MEKLDRMYKEWLLSIFISAILLIILYNLSWPMKVDGNSMENTLKSGQIVFINRLYGLVESLDPGEIVVINYKEQGKKEYIVKRIIGVAGDHIEIKNGQVIVNGELQVEKDIKETTEGNIDLYVPVNAFFVMGDNRSSSKDSRSFGCVLEKDVEGKVLINSK